MNREPIPAEFRKLSDNFKQLLGDWGWGIKRRESHRPCSVTAPFPILWDNSCILHIWYGKVCTTSTSKSFALSPYSVGKFRQVNSPVFRLLFGRATSSHTAGQLSHQLSIRNGKSFITSTTHGLAISPLSGWKILSGSMLRSFSSLRESPLFLYWGQLLHIWASDTVNHLQLPSLTALPSARVQGSGWKNSVWVNSPVFHLLFGRAPCSQTAGQLLNQLSIRNGKALTTSTSNSFEVSPCSDWKNSVRANSLVFFYSFEASPSPLERGIK